MEGWGGEASSLPTCRALTGSRAAGEQDTPKDSWWLCREGRREGAGQGWQPIGFFLLGTQSWEVKSEASVRHSSGNSPFSLSTHSRPALLGRQAGPQLILQVEIQVQQCLKLG